MPRTTWVWVLVAVVVLAGFIVAVVAGGAGTFADDMNHACAYHHGVFSFNADQGGGVCRDGWAVAP